MKFTESDRLLAMPPYVFSEINAIKADAEKRGIKLLSVGIGDPDLPTPKAIVEKFVDAIRKAENHGYSPYEGPLEFRKAAAEWFEGRFGVALDPVKEIVALIGSKEGVAHFPLAFVNPGDKCLYPSPGYPIFQTSILLAGGIPVPIPHRAENGFLPDPKELEALIVEHKPKYMLLNFPSNPTSAVCTKEPLADYVALAKKHQTILVGDLAYSEIYYDANQKPVSMMEIEGAKDVCIEFHSLSKTFGMTGCRTGFAVGNPSLVAGLLRVKTNIDSGPLLAVQEASVFALQNAERLVAPLRDVYARRREIVLKGLREMGIEYFEPKATFFVWAKVPGNRSSMAFTKELIEKQGLVVTPGSGFGPEGEGFFRIALTVPEEKLKEALERLKRGIHG